MTEAEAIEAISERWRSGWEQAHPEIPYALHNEAFRPQDASAAATVTFGPLVARQLTQGPIGARLFEYRGVINVKLYGPLDAGARQLAMLAGDVRAIFASQTIGGAPGVEPVYSAAAGSVPGKEGKWATLLVPVPFDFTGRA
ncbi:MAG: hypothetical protein QOI20_3281 [Acidimicrobiaceae bacterium]|nr:hypothetical protein [Acidimicrobiaceae bacterium]